MSESFDLGAEVARRTEALGQAGERPGNVHLQAWAVLVDASLSPAERAEGFAQLLVPMLSWLNVDQANRFRQLALEQDEHAALVYLTEVTGGP